MIRPFLNSTFAIWSCTRPKQLPLELSLASTIIPRYLMINFEADINNIVYPAIGHVERQIQFNHS